MHMCVHSFGFMEEGGGVGGFLGVFAVEGRETRILLLSGHGAEGNEFGGGGGKAERSRTRTIFGRPG